MRRLRTGAPVSIPLVPSISGVFPHAFTRQGHVRGRDDHPPPLRIALTAVQQFPRRTTGSPINRATSGMPDFGRSQSLFPGSGSPPLPLLITGCQNLATVRVLAPGLEFGCFRSA